MKSLGGVFAGLVLFALAGLVAVWVWTHPRFLPPDRVPLTGKVDHILIEKADRRMTVFRAGKPLQTYQIALGFSPYGDKTRQGDGRTPEGVFQVDRRNAQSAFHLSLGLDYPRPADRARATAAGVDPGGDIMIHGQPNGRADGTMLTHDWTAGCIALSDQEIEELFAAVDIGTPVEIRP